MYSIWTGNERVLPKLHFLDFRVLFEIPAWFSLRSNFYSPALKKWAILDLPCPSVILWFCHSVTSQMKIFRHTFLKNLRPRRLKLGTHVDSGQTGIRVLLLIRPFISSFFFLSNFQTLKFFVTLFAGTVRSRRLKHGTHVDSGQMYLV